VVTEGFSASQGQQIESTELTHTDEGCESTELMEQEAVYFARLQEAHRWWIAIDTHIFLGNGRLLVGARPQ
jgi:hypothetical protein